MTEQEGTNYQLQLKEKTNLRFFKLSSLFGLVLSLLNFVSNDFTPNGKYALWTGICVNFITSADCYFKVQEYNKMKQEDEKTNSTREEALINPQKPMQDRALRWKSFKVLSKAVSLGGFASLVAIELPMWLI